MIIIKCDKCGKDVPRGTPSCPNCGNKICSNFLVLEEDYFKNLVNNVITIFFLIALSTIIFFFLKIYFTKIQTGINQLVESSLNQPMPVAAENFTVQINPDGRKIYPLQYNKLWGHEFFTSKIDKTGNADVGLVAKQTIAKLLNALNFPPKLTKTLAIVNVDTALVGSTILLKVPWVQGISAFPVVQQLEGGLYGMLANGSVIFLNNLVGYDLAVLTHELGHLISYQLTDQEWEQYYKLRGIPSNMSRRSFSNWALSPEEDFAEVYKATYKSAVVGPSEYSMTEDKWTIKTKYGIFIPTKYTYNSSCDSIEQNVISGLLNTWEKNTLSYQTDYYMPSTDMMNKLQDQASADPKVQDCRKQSNELNPFGGPAFISQADLATQEFIKNVAARINSR